MESNNKFIHGRDEDAAKKYLLSIGFDDKKVQANSPILIPAMYIIMANNKYKELNGKH